MINAFGSAAGILSPILTGLVVKLTGSFRSGSHLWRVFDSGGEHLHPLGGAEAHASGPRQGRAANADPCRGWRQSISEIVDVFVAARLRQSPHEFQDVILSEPGSPATAAFRCWGGEAKDLCIADAESKIFARSESHYKG